MTGLVVAGAAALAASAGGGAERSRRQGRGGCRRGRRRRLGGEPDRADLDRSQIIGNRELPKVTYIVPWKKPGRRRPQRAGRWSACSTRRSRRLDRDVFRRQVRYDAQAVAQHACRSRRRAAPAK